MKRLLVVAFVLGVCCLLVAAPTLAKDEKKVEAKKVELPAGQMAFEKANCSMCHTVLSAGIGEEPKTDEEKEKALDGPPDLSLAGTGRTAEWLIGFLQKTEKLNDKVHMMPFKGTEEDLASLVDWMLTLKAPEKVEKGEKAAKAHEGCDHGEEKVNEEEKAHEDCDHDSHEKGADTDAKEGE